MSVSPPSNFGFTPHAFASFSQMRFYHKKYAIFFYREIFLFYIFWKKSVIKKSGMSFSCTNSLGVPLMNDGYSARRLLTLPRFPPYTRVNFQIIFVCSLERAKKKRKEIFFIWNERKTFTQTNAPNNYIHSHSSTHNEANFQHFIFFAPRKGDKSFFSHFFMNTEKFFSFSIPLCRVNLMFQSAQVVWGGFHLHLSLCTLFRIFFLSMP